MARVSEYLESCTIDEIFYMILLSYMISLYTRTSTSVFTILYESIFYGIFPKGLLL